MPCRVSVSRRYARSRARPTSKPGVYSRHGLLDRDARERQVQVVAAALVADLARARDHVGQPLHRALDHDHEVVVVGVGDVQLQHRELGVVPRRHALVAEVAIDLVDAFEAADHQALEIQLRRDAQVHVHVERVVMRLERPRRGAARDGLQHRRLDFEEVHRVEEIAQVAQYPVARDEHGAALLVDDQVHVTLAITRVDVGHAVPLVRQRPQRLDQHAQFFHAHRQLARLGLEQHAGGREDVADVVLLEGLVGVAERIALQEDLDLPGAILQLGEARLAHDALEHHAAGHVHAHRVLFEPLRRLVAVFGRLTAWRARRDDSRWETRARPRPSPASRTCASLARRSAIKPFSFCVSLTGPPSMMLP